MAELGSRSLTQIYQNNDRSLRASRDVVTDVSRTAESAVNAEMDDYKYRQEKYREWWAYYTNKIYLPKEQGGYREAINERLGESNRVLDLAGLYNPVQRAIDAYQLVFAGSFGKEIVIDKEADEEGTPVNESLVKAIAKVWAWSNINREKELLCRYVPCLGTAGIRVVAINDDDPERRRVYMKVEHPTRILDIELDDRGNLSQILFEYNRLEGELGKGQELHVIQEYMSKDRFWSTRDGEPYDLINEVESGEFSEYENESGIVPYVLVTQNYMGSPFGVPSFFGNEPKIDHINALATHINAQIHRHVTVTWFMEAGGPPPEVIPLGDMNVVYVQRELGSQHAATIEPMVANLSLSEAESQVEDLLAELQNSLPELKATDGQFLSHQSGGTVAQLRLPAEQRLMTARANYEDALIRAQKIAVSYGILYDIPGFDLGTGTGTRVAADEAFESGAENHKFVVRPALPYTVDEKLTMAKTQVELEGGKSSPGGDNVAVTRAEDREGAANREEISRQPQLSSSGA